MRLVVLLCAVTLLVCPPASCDVQKTVARKNLNLVFELTQQCLASVNGTLWVEDLSHLTEGRNRCGDTFFCKVQEIVGNLKHFCRTSRSLVANLKMYNMHRHVNCTVAVEGMTRVNSEVTVFTLMKNLMHCINQRNFRGNK